MGRADPMVLRENSNQGLLRWFELTGYEAFKVQGPATRSPECKEHLQNQSVGGRSSEWYRVIAPGQFPNPRKNLSTGKDWWAHLDSNQGPTGYEPVALTN
jgi:hypothetical protein